MPGSHFLAVSTQNLAFRRTGNQSQPCSEGSLQKIISPSDECNWKSLLLKNQI